MKYKVFIEMTLHTGKEGFSVVVDGNDEDDAKQIAIFEMNQEYKNIASYFVDEVNELEYEFTIDDWEEKYKPCLLYTSPSPRDGLLSRMPSSA